MDISYSGFTKEEVRDKALADSHIAMIALQEGNLTKAEFHFGLTIDSIRELLGREFIEKLQKEGKIHE